MPLDEILAAADDDVLLALIEREREYQREYGALYTAMLLDHAQQAIRRLQDGS